MEVKRYQPHQLPNHRKNPEKAHNFYPDLVNEWAPNAKKSPKLPSLQSLAILAILLLATLLVSIQNYSLIQDSNSPQVSTTIRKVYVHKPAPKELINYAADFNGARILYRLTSESFFSNEIMQWEYVYNNSPDLILSQDNSPGNCWAIAGESGQATVLLPHPIIPRHFAIVHAKLADHATAPRAVCFYNRHKLLTCQEFKLDGQSPKFYQLFSCESNCEESLSEVTLKILSNHGAPQTCEYQLMVHGDLPSTD